MGKCQTTLNSMADIKFSYFDLRVKGEPARLLLAYSGAKYEDDRVVCPWDNMEPWMKLKPTLPYGQLPCLRWNGELVCQSMTICRFLAREFGIAGRNSLEMAQVDEIVDAIQDAIEANYKAWNNKANRREELKTLTEKTFPAALSLLEKRLTERGGQFMVGNTFSTFAQRISCLQLFCLPSPNSQIWFQESDKCQTSRIGWRQDQQMVLLRKIS